MQKFLKNWGKFLFLLFFATLCLGAVSEDPAEAFPLDAPTGVSATDGWYADRIRVTWGKVAGATSYLVYRSTSEHGIQTMVYTTSTSPFYDHVVTPGVIYFYWVKSADDIGFSDFSASASGYRAVAPPADCVADDTTMCLNNGRFKVTVSWKNQNGQTGVGRVVPYGSDDSGVLWFFDGSNWEMLVKVLNGCGINNRFWVSFAAPTDQQFTLTVTDTDTGLTHQYFNPLKHPANAVIDTSTFDTCTQEDALLSDLEEGLAQPVDIEADDDIESNTLDGSPADSGQTPSETDPTWGGDDDFDEEVAGALQPSEDSGLSLSGCVSSDTRMCLNRGRFEVRVDWRDQGGRTGVGRVVPYGSDDSGMFWFFSESNWEMLVKVLDGCGLNSHFWVFFAATTDQQFTLTVTDTSSGKVIRYVNPLKHPADAVTDTLAFDTCP